MDNLIAKVRVAIASAALASAAFWQKNRWQLFCGKMLLARMVHHPLCEPQPQGVVSGASVNTTNPNARNASAARRTDANARWRPFLQCTAILSGCELRVVDHHSSHGKTAPRISWKTETVPDSRTTLSRILPFAPQHHSPLSMIFCGDNVCHGVGRVRASGGGWRLVQSHVALDGGGNVDPPTL